MDGITDFPMRQVQMEIAKPDVVFTEFINIEGYVRNPNAFDKKLYFSEDQQPVVVQAYGSCPEDFYLALQKISKLGFSGIDINMGCPARKVVDRKSGGGLIGNFDLAGEIIESCLKAVADSGRKIPLSVKTRIGKKEFDLDWIKFLSQFPIDLVTVHGRLLKNRHSGPVEWDKIGLAAKILRAKGIYCLGNGGVGTRREAESISKKYSLDGVLIGQAAWGNPWVFKSEQNQSTEEILNVIKDHTDKVDSFYDPEGFVTIRKHLARYVKGLSGAKRLKVKLLLADSGKEVNRIIDQYVNIYENENKEK